MLNKHVEDQNTGVKPVRFSDFSRLAHACSCVLTYSFFVTIKASMWRINMGNFGIKPVKISVFNMLAHVCSCLLMCTLLLFFVTIKGLIMLDKHEEDQNREFWL